MLELLARILEKSAGSSHHQAVNHSQRFFTDTLQYYATAAYPCSYLDGHLARSQVVAPSDAVDAERYDVLIRHGFRRSGSFVYRPQCDGCRACVSIRLPVADFKPNRSQARAWKQHAALICRVIEPIFSAEHYALYQRYQKARHPGGGMDVDDEVQYSDFLVHSNVSSRMVEFRQPSPGLGPAELKMVSIIDQLQDGLSAVYTFYAPEARQNFGNFNVLWQIRQAQALGLTYVYLGYWIKACKKMAYKSRFQPFELLINGQWQLMRDER
jgi:arginine-tRNA-protein transferase